MNLKKIILLALLGIFTIITKISAEEMLNFNYEEAISTSESDEDLKNHEDNSAKQDLEQIDELLAIDDHPALTDHKIAKIIALNKITATSKEMILKTGEPSQYFGNIEIKVHKCLKNSDPYAPDNQILLTITESRIDEDQILIFQGWLMSSSMSVSTFEHPVYEVFAKDCL